MFLADLADNITSIDFDTVDKLNRVITTINRLDHEPVLVLVQIARVVVKVEANTNLHGLLVDTCSTLEVKL